MEMRFCVLFVCLCYEVYFTLATGIPLNSKSLVRGILLFYPK